MITQSHERPPSKQKLQGGTLINFDIVEKTKEVNGKIETYFEYTQVKVSDNPNKGEIIEAILNEKHPIGNQLAMIFNGEDTPAHKKELDDYKALRKSVKTIVSSL